jgi:ribosomal protein L23
MWLVILTAAMLRMNKPEIKDYLESIYGIDVEGVRTQIVLGMLTQIV